jgi:phage N-6-adenine-methyltransferase
MTDPLLTVEKALELFAARLAQVEASVAELAALVARRPHIPKSQSVEWGTPLDLVAALAAEFGPFDLDAAASDELHVCDAYFTAEMDGLALPWFGRVWLNPPYGVGEGSWVHKALVEVAAGRAQRVVMLVAAKTGVSWWQELVKPAEARGDCTVRFLPGRLTFRGAKSCAPFPSAVLVFEKRV